MNPKGGVTLRMRPFIIGVTNKTYKDLIRAAYNAGATAISTEFFCLEDRSVVLKTKHLSTMSRACGFDLYSFYKKYSTNCGYMRLNRKVKLPYVNEMFNLCKELGMRFYTSDAHFKELCCNGSCCGLPEEFNYSRGQFCEALVLARKNGKVTWNEIAKDLEYAKKFQWKKATGYNTRSAEHRAQFDNFTMFEFLRWLWNNPNSGGSPYKHFEGILKPIGLDENQDVIYEYDKKYGLEEMIKQHPTQGDTCEDRKA